MSSTRSRSGGSVISNAARRKYRSRRSVESRVVVVQVAIRGRDHAKRRGPRLGAADRRHFVLLQHAQQLDLHAGRNVAGLVEEHRALVGQFQQSLPRVLRRR